MLLLRCGLALLITLPLFAEQDAALRGWQIYQQARQAAGGGQNLSDYSYSQTTQIDHDGRKLQVVSRMGAIPGKVQRLEVDSAAGMVTMVVKGDRGWRIGPQGKQPLPPEGAQLQAKEDARVTALFDAKVQQRDVRFREEATVNGRPADVVELTDVGGGPLRLYIDRETKDVLKRMYVGDAPNGMMAQVEEYLSDYRDVGGFRWPFAKRVVRNGQDAATSTLQDVNLNQGLTVEQLTK